MNFIEVQVERHISVIEIHYIEYFDYYWIYFNILIFKMNINSFICTRICHALKTKIKYKPFMKPL
jgi:hypothetical protein